jgi:hypothetical protein
MPLTLEEESRLLPLAEKATDLIASLIMEGNPDLYNSYDNEFKKIIEQISAISPLLSGIYLDWHNNRIPKMKSRLYSR